MKKERTILALCTGCLISAASLQAQTGKDSTQVARSYAINEVVVTGHTQRNGCTPSAHDRISGGTSAT